MRLKIYIPDCLDRISKMVLEVLEDRFTGLEFEVFLHKDNYYKIENETGKLKIRFPALFIQSEKEKWLQKREPEDWGLNYFRFKTIENLPVLFHGEPQSETYNTNIDFIGSIFFLMHRYHEEVEKLPIDKFGRVLSKHSFLVRNNLHSKPWADVYIDLFKDVITKKFDLNLSIKNNFQILPTHDVDRPFEFPYYTLPHLIKRIGGDLLKKKSIGAAVRRLSGYKSVKSGNIDLDPLNTFQWIMEQSEKAGCISTFHFIAESTNSGYDQEYALENKEIKKLFKSIDERGHKIGLHPSFDATEMEGQIQKEFQLLKEASQEFTDCYSLWKSRNHYLKWNASTISELEKAGIDIDQTLGFAELPGFRCGTSNSFKAFNFETNSFSSVIIEPLIVMEVSLFDKDYLNLSNNLDHAWQLITNLKNECKKYNGNFTILWHNNHLLEDDMRIFYTECIK